MKVSAIITAAGSGSRLKKTVSSPLNLPKALWPVDGKPLLNYSLKPLLDSVHISEIVIVLPAKFVKQFKKECAGLKKKIKVVAGLSKRKLSV